MPDCIQLPGLPKLARSGSPAFTDVDAGLRVAINLSRLARRVGRCGHFKAPNMQVIELGFWLATAVQYRLHFFSRRIAEKVGFLSAARAVPGSVCLTLPNFVFSWRLRRRSIRAAPDQSRR